MEFKLGKNIAVGAYACTIIGALPNLKYLPPPLNMPALGKTYELVRFLASLLLWGTFQL